MGVRGGIWCLLQYSDLRCIIHHQDHSSAADTASEKIILQPIIQPKKKTVNTNDTGTEKDAVVLVLGVWGDGPAEKGEGQ